MFYCEHTFNEDNDQANEGLLRSGLYCGETGYLRNAG